MKSKYIAIEYIPTIHNKQVVALEEINEEYHLNLQHTQAQPHPTTRGSSDRDQEKTSVTKRSFNQG